MNLKTRTYKLYSNIKQRENYIYAFIFLFFAFTLRISWLTFTSLDYNIYLKNWYEEIKNIGGLKAFASTIGNYTVMYKYLIVLMTYIPIHPLVAYKLVSCIFDTLLAIYSGLCVYEISKNKHLSLITYAIILFLPNIWLNSAVWAQCDSIFTCFCIICFYYLLKNNSNKTIIFYTIALSFKIQAIFFLPVIVIALLRHDLGLKSLFFIPITYFICILPAICFGMNIKHALFGAYIMQVTDYTELTMLAPNLYMFLPRGFGNNESTKQLICMSIGICGITGFLLWNSNIIEKDKKIFYLYISYFLTLLIPFILPKMHERYFYLSDVFAVIFAIITIKKFYISVITIFSSLTGLLAYLFGSENINLQLSSLFMFLGINLVLYNLIDLTSKKTDTD